MAEDQILHIANNVIIANYDYQSMIMIMIHIANNVIIANYGYQSMIMIMIMIMVINSAGEVAGGGRVPAVPGGVERPQAARAAALRHVLEAVAAALRGGRHPRRPQRPAARRGRAPCGL